MKAITSFFNVGLLRNDIKRFSWLGITFLFLLFLGLPLKIIMGYSNGYFARVTDPMDLTWVVRSLLDFPMAPLLLLTMMVIPVLAGCVIFNYIQNPRAVDSMHALPIKRSTTYNTHILCGLLLLLIPVILNALVTLSITKILQLNLFSLTQLLTFTLVSLLLAAFIFILTVAVGMGTGSTILQAFFTYVFIFLPYLLFFLVIYHSGIFLVGLPTQHYFSDAEFLIPVVKMLNYFSTPLGSGQVAVYILLMAALYFAGLWMYKNRRVEVAGDAISFSWLKPIFIFGVMFCTASIFGMYFWEIQQNSRAWLYFGYILGAVIGFVIARIMVKKTIKINDRVSLKQFGSFAVIFLILISIIRFDLVGYTKNLPTEDKIKKVYVDSSFYPLERVENRDEAVKTLVKEYPVMKLPIYTEAEDIQTIYRLHEKILTGIKEGTYFQEDSQSDYWTAKPYWEVENIAIRYELEDGSYFYRFYTVSTGLIKEEMKALYKTETYKASHEPFWLVEEEKVANVILTSNYYGKYAEGKDVFVDEPQLIQEMMSAIKQDIAVASEPTNNDRYVNSIEVILLIKPENETEYRQVSQRVSAKQVNFISWIKKAGFYEKLYLVPDDVDQMVVFQDLKDEVREILELQQKEAMPAVATSEQTAYGEPTASSTVLGKIETLPHVYITGEQEKTDVLNNMLGYGWYSGNYYSVYVRYTNGTEELFSLGKDSAPDFITDPLP